MMSNLLCELGCISAGGGYKQLTSDQVGAELADDARLTEPPRFENDDRSSEFPMLKPNPV
jgi:hypothetical protein